MKKIPINLRDLFEYKTKSFAFLATTMGDGSPQVTPVWFSTEGDAILINSVKGRTKDRNMRSRPEVALVIMDPGNPYRYIQIRGKVTQITEVGARDHINYLAKKYTGDDIFPGPKEDIRVIYKIEIQKTNAVE
jgi:PPOX class probable F420-dependent enzyme